MRRRQAAPLSASSIHTLRTRKRNHVMGDVAVYINVVFVAQDDPSKRPVLAPCNEREFPSRRSFF
jgi:hypothetical protein